MQMVMEKGTEKELPNHCNYISSEKSSFIYWFENGSQVSAFDSNDTDVHHALCTSLTISSWSPMENSRPNSTPTR